MCVTCTAILRVLSNVIDLQAETRGNPQSVLPAAGAGGHAHYRSRAGVPIFAHLDEPLWVMC